MNKTIYYLQKYTRRYAPYVVFFLLNVLAVESYNYSLWDFNQLAINWQITAIYVFCMPFFLLFALWLYNRFHMRKRIGNAGATFITILMFVALIMTVVSHIK